MQEKNKLVQEALIQMKQVEEAIAENAKGILASTMKEEINQLVKESLSEQEDDEIKLDIDMDDEMDSDEEKMDFDMDIDNKDEMEMDFDMDIDSDESPIDLTGASDDEILKVFKAMGEEDGIIVKKDDDYVHLTDNDTDSEYLIKLGESEEEDEILDEEMDEEMYGSFGNMKRKDYKGDKYYDENDRTVKDADLYGVGGDDFDTEEFDTFQKLYDKYGDKQRWFGPNDGEKMFNLYKEKTGKPFKVKTRRPMEGEMGEGYEYDDVDDVNPDDFYNDEDSYKYSKFKKKDSDFGNGAIFDSIFGESKVDKVLSKYFEVSKKEIVENKQRTIEKNTRTITEVRRQMKSVVKLTETIEQELSSQKFLEENVDAKIVGKTNKNNLVFENKGKEIKITPEGLVI